MRHFEFFLIIFFSYQLCINKKKISINEDNYYSQTRVWIYQTLVAVINITVTRIFLIFKFFFINTTFIFNFYRCR